MSDRQARFDRWSDSEQEGDEPKFQALNREQAQALAARHPSVSPWRVVAVQAVVGLVLATATWLVTGRQGWAWSLLYGAAAVVVPGALMARGMTSRLSSLAPGVSAVSFMLWQFGKMGISVAMLMLAPKLVPDLSWPALLVALVLCIEVYWLALSWRGRRKR
ncbi:ATP synthase subunit I [Ideonella azotifigens]|uniref:ATP synthase subunit I n=1 Tax=Ideonella azotifigens TaxID=513160 RepID=A0ABN1KAT3_9BURK|nr:ATP synthase subunit I [Ideonella azotifigens]MCD2338776.1 ATP synthase subunit I [Ideonella azotifigens]